MDTWNILFVIAVIALIATFFSGQNIVWGGLAIGIVIGIIIALIYLISGEVFNLQIVKRSAIIGTLASLLFEVFTKVANSSSKIREKNTDSLNEEIEDQIELGKYARKYAIELSQNKNDKEALEYFVLQLIMAFYRHTAIERTVCKH
jgi:hypothetical protein